MNAFHSNKEMRAKTGKPIRFRFHDSSKNSSKFELKDMLEFGWGKLRFQFILLDIVKFWGLWFECLTSLRRVGWHVSSSSVGKGKYLSGPVFTWIKSIILIDCAGLIWSTDVIFWVPWIRVEPRHSLRQDRQFFLVAAIDPLF